MDNKLSPKFFFLSLGVLVTLIATVTSFLNLVFQTLNHKFPDALNAVYYYGYNTYNFDAARSAMATLIIMLPAYLIISHFWRKAARGSLGRIDDVIRKWMLYLIMFLAAAVAIVDLVTLVKYFVAGEVTTRFLLKVGITLIVAAKVGFYYVMELRGQKKWGPFNIHTWSPSIFAALVVLLIVWSFSVIGTPAEQRAWRLDERRTQDLQSIQWQVINYWQQKEVLPEKLEDLSNPLSGFMVPVDPEFEKGNTYEYKKTENMTFELCANFSAVMPQGWQEYGGVRPMFDGFSEDAAISARPYPGIGGDSWDHDAGRTCFARTIDPDIYPPFPKEQKVF